MYAGFRSPGIWPIMGILASLQDGFLRRTGVGTLLHLLPVHLRLDYHLLAALHYMVLGVLLLVVLRLTLVRISSAATLAIFFLSGSGSFLFHEVGYLEQWVFLLFLCALWTFHKSRIISALLMAYAVLCHELTLVFTLPLYVLYALHHRARLPRLALLVAPALALATLLFAARAPTMSLEMTFLKGILNNANFTPRFDYLELLQRNYELKVAACTHFLARDRGALLLIVLFSLIQFLRHRAALRSVPAGRRRLISLCAATCCVAPLLLGFIATDGERWQLLASVNCAVVSVLSSKRLRPGATKLIDLAPLALGLGWVVVFRPALFDYQLLRSGTLPQMYRFFVEGLPSIMRRIPIR